MRDFITDVISFEKKINGDVNIFKPFENKTRENPPINPIRELIKTIFVSSIEMNNNVVSNCFY